MDKRERYRSRRLQEERIKKRRRLRRRKRILRRLVLALLAGICILLLLLVVWLTGLFFGVSEEGMAGLSWNSTKPVVMLDAGHGGKDQGASYEEVLEKDLNLAIAQKTKELLLEAGYRVYMTRKEDAFLDKYDRADDANRKNVDIFVSIHCNFLEEGQADGIETFYAESKSGESQALAEAIQANIIEQTAAQDRGAKTADYVVIKETDMPSALVEVGFLSDAAERERLQEEGYQQKLAEGIAAGIADYLEIEKDFSAE